MRAYFLDYLFDIINNWYNSKFIMDTLCWCWLNEWKVDFDQFNDVDELYSSLPLEKVEALEDLVSLGPSSLVKVKFIANYSHIALFLLE